ncbi:hypothetical protein [Streptomyces sp. NPDC001340]
MTGPVLVPGPADLPALLGDVHEDGTAVGRVGADEDDTPAEWAEYKAANAEFFDDLGSPGGAAAHGLIDRDHPVVAGQPVRTA